MKRLSTSFFIVALFLGAAFVSCKNEKTEEGGGPTPPTEDSVVVVQSAIPDTIPWNGGSYELTVATNASSWQLKTITDDDQLGAVTEYKDKKISVEIPQYLGEEEQSVTVQVMSKKKWVDVCHVKQRAGSVKIGETVWLKGNLSLRQQPLGQMEALLEGGDAFIAGSESEAGLYFKHKSTYGILSEGTAYSGTAYNPAPSQMPLRDIPAKNGDPCSLLAPAGKWRLPSVSELSELGSYCEDEVKTVDGMACRTFDGGKLLMPLAGACDSTGSIGYKQTNGGYWGSGEDIDGNGAIMLLGTDDYYVFLSYSITGALGSVRCVKNAGGAQYVSHTPTDPQTYEAFKLSVTTKSDLPEYEVMAACDEDNQFVAKAGKSTPTVSFDIPVNDGTEDRVYKIYVDGDYTGKSVTQKYKAGYALYVSHTPEGKIPGDAFELTVTCKSDLDEFPVALQGTDVDLTQKGTKENPVVKFDVPVNAGAEARELKIIVNGVDSKISVVQESKYTDVLVGQTTWAKGNVVLKDGAFAIGAPTEYGLYFKFNSIYGIPSEEDVTQYQGTAYNPNPVAIGWKDIAADNGGDPCRLIAPADTWRLPTKSEIESLNGTAGNSFTLNGVLGQHYAGDKLFVPAAGAIYDNQNIGLAEYMGRGEFGYIWSSTRIYSMSFEEAVCQVFSMGENCALSARCVKNVNYAFYVSHTPAAAQTSDAFTLKVTCKSDLSSFSVALKGGDVNLTESASKTAPTAEFSVPENTTDADRTLKIYVNGIYTGKSVVQAKKEDQPQEFRWAKGNIVLKDGAFAIGAPTDLGLFFKYKSSYGIAVDGDAYSGKAYMPAETTIAWKDIPYNDSDPCALIAPVGTWRMPTQADVTELIKTYEVTTIDGVTGMNLGPDKLFFPAAGYRKVADGSLGPQGRYWTSDTKSAENAFLLAFATTATAKPSVTLGQPFGNGYSVRCVTGTRK